MADQTNIAQQVSLEERVCTFAIEGAGHPEDTSRPLDALEYATAYFRLLQKLAEKRGGLAFSGLQVVDKCIGFRTSTEQHPDIVLEVAEVAGRLIADTSARPPRGATPLVKSCRRLATSFDQPAEFFFGKKRFTVGQATAETQRAWGRTTIRAIVNGMKVEPPSIHLRPFYRYGEFTVAVKDQETALSLREIVNREVEVKIAALFHLDESRFERAQLLELAVVEEATPEEAHRRWSEWYTAVSGGE